MRHSIQMLSLVAISLPILLTGQESVASGCEMLTAGLERKMSEYRRFKQQNLEQIARLENAKADCSAEGADISRRVSEAAKSNSCEAQREASGLDTEIENLGRRCKGILNEISRLQRELKDEFIGSKNDLDEALAYIGMVRSLQDGCQEDSDVATTMAEAFVKLEGGIVSVETQSQQGERDYTNLKEASRQLAQHNTSLADACGSEESHLQSRVNQTEELRQLKRADSASGVDRKPASGISGMERLESAADKLSQ